MKLIHYILILIFGIQSGFTQTYIYQHYGVDEGLPSSEVYDIYQDNLGYLWFATDKGLSRFNGYEFENFTTQDGLPGNTILDFFPQENGEIWCFEYHSQNLFYFDNVFNGFKKYKYNKALKSALNKNSIIKSISIDKQNNLILGGYGISGIISISDKGSLSRLYDKHTITSSKYVKIAFLEKKGVFFLAYHDYKKSNELNLLETYNAPSTRLDYIPINSQYTVIIDKKLGILKKGHSINYINTKQNPTGIRRINDHHFFVGYYSNGAEIRDVNGKVLNHFLPNKSVSSFLQDMEGGYWFSTIDDGIFYIKNPNIKIFTDQHITSLVKTHNNHLIAGFNSGDIKNLTSNDVLYKGIRNNKAFVSYHSEKNTLYGWSDFKFFNFSSNTFNIHEFNANKLPENIENRLISTDHLGIYTFQNNSVVKYNTKNKAQDACIFKDTILIGTTKGLEIKVEDSILKHQPLKILQSRIDDIDVNKAGNTAYMATQGEGVVVYGKTTYSIKKEHGLTNNIISEIYFENDSVIWACSNTGLNRIRFYNDKSYKITKLTKADGLISNNINNLVIINDTVWVATKKGLCYFNKNVLEEKKRLNIRSLTIEEVIVNNQNIIKNNIKLKHNQNNIDFKLQAISIKNTANIDYFYRLKEIDSTWTKTKSRTISFPSLSPGNYTFEAKANVFNNPNNLITSYSFKILPPFWKSWWFNSICVLFFSGLVYWFFKIRIFTYNKDVIRELIRLTIKRLKRKELCYKFRSNGEDFKIPTHDILFVNSQGNYIDLVTIKKTYTIRCKISKFISTTPDALEYLRVHRSYIVRIDQVSSKGKNWVVIKDHKIPVGENYLSELDKIQF